METVWEPWHWTAFSVFVAVMLLLDLTVFHRGSREASLRESAGWTVFWCLLALGFNGLIWYWAAQQLPPKEAARPAVEFLSGYLLEWSLSMDNVFVFAVIFTFFRVPAKYQHRILFWGILGAVFMRLSFILVGTELLKEWDWIIAGFGVFLVWTAYKLVTGHGADPQPEKNLLMRLARWLLPVTKESHGNQFFAREGGKLCITPLFLVLLVIESTDVVFAVDSVPAILSITHDPFIAFTSNVFAILGLRALYFLLAGAMDLFRYLNYGLSAILAFVGVKMIAEYVAKLRGWVGPDDHLLPAWGSLAVIVPCLAISILASLWVRRAEETSEKPAPAVPTRQAN